MVPLPLRPLRSAAFPGRILRWITTTAFKQPEPTARRFVSPETSSPTIPGTPQFDSLKYFVHRTRSQQLPIYHLAKRGGTLHQTRIRRIDGNVAALRDDLQKALGLKDEHITINQLTKHIIVKGWRQKDVAKFLTDRHF